MERELLKSAQGEQEDSEEGTLSKRRTEGRWVSALPGGSNYGMAA
jgi:hypothetical protein